MWFLIILVLVLMLVVAHQQKQIDTLWYFHKHGTSIENEEFRNYIGKN